MSESMIERVKAAIMEEENPDSRDQYAAMALAAIKAMREPTEAMAEAGNGCYVMGHVDSYKAMIDAAINEKDPPPPKG